jgi:hypothetical protein
LLFFLGYQVLLVQKLIFEYTRTFNFKNLIIFKIRKKFNQG